MSEGPPLVTVVVNLHREGPLCLPTLDSLWTCVSRAEAAGIGTEVLLVLDRGDAATTSLLRENSRGARILDTTFGDLGKARNRGISEASGEYATFLDGDDLWGDEWLTRCVELARDRSSRDFVIHPQTNLCFGRGMQPYFWVHPDMSRETLRTRDVVVDNVWTALSFAPTDLYRRFPYRPNEFGLGYGYEDWLWNVETMAAGIQHVAARDTIHFIRKKQGSGLLAESNSQNVVPRFSALEGLAHGL